MNSPSDRKRVELLFRTIQQIHSINKEVIKNFRSYAQCFVLSELMALDPDEEYIRYEGCVETNRILSVKKPEIPSCPPFDPILKGWRYSIILSATGANMICLRIWFPLYPASLDGS